MFSACSGKNVKEAAEAFQQGFEDAQGKTSVAKEEKTDWHLDGNTLTYGNHTYTMEGNIDFDFVEGAKASVTFTNVPSDLQEFKTVYEQLLGKTIYGVCAMMPMAFELWGRNHQTGEQALQMICGSSCYNEVMRQLPGVWGGRFSGAGFKGACIALVDPAYKEQIQQQLTERYLEQFPEYEKTFQVFWVKPDDGARFVED